MKKITSVKITNNYITINFDDQSKLRISDDTYFEMKLKANKELNDQEYSFLKNESNVHEAYMSALNKIKYKDRSEYTIRNLLYDDFNLIKPEVDGIIHKLKRYDFINDDRYTKDLIENSHLKYYGYNKIKSDLVADKINSERIEKFLIDDFQKEYERALEYANKTVHTIRNKNQFQIENSLRQKLLYRGYKNNVVNAVVSEIHIEVDFEKEEKLLEKDYEKVLRRYSKRYEGYDLRVRLFNYLRSKGYDYEQINNLLDEMEKSNE